MGADKMKTNTSVVGVLSEWHFTQEIRNETMQQVWNEQGACSISQAQGI
jgi:hypothetical protein